MKCPRCGADNKEEATSCWQCYGNMRDAGAPGTVPARTPAGPPRPVAAAPTKAGFPLVPAIIVAAVVVLGGGGFYVWQQRSGNPGKTVEVFFTALGKWDFDALKNCCTASSGATIDQAKQQINSMPGGVSMLQNAMKFSDLQIVETSFEGSKAKVRFKIKMSLSFLGKSMDRSEEDTITLVKEGGSWKVDFSSAGGAQPFGGKMGF